MNEEFCEKCKHPLTSCTNRGRAGWTERAEALVWEVTHREKNARVRASPPCSEPRFHCPKDRPTQPTRLTHRHSIRRTRRAALGFLTRHPCIVKQRDRQRPTRAKPLNVVPALRRGAVVVAGVNSCHVHASSQTSRMAPGLGVHPYEFMDKLETLNRE